MMEANLRDGWRFCCLLLAVFIVGGCATMSESECINADWREVGRNDGLEGKRQTQLARHYDACIRYGITPGRDEYMAGREAGLTVYCTQDSGYWEGRYGAGYQRVCPASSEPAFLTGYRAGQSVYDAIENIRSVRAQLESAKARIGSLEDEIRKIESPGNESDTDEKKPEGNIEDRRREIRRLEDELDSLRALRAFAVAEYARAIERANNLGYPEEFRLDEVL
ncbi:MAG: DUF2799 domain-containing protein [Gammaproteobacteria bacterium]|nr:DUF2799 domain-containing protein [Gammaproteobacteria bacterium]